jgi:hypothetical protein
VFQQIFVNAAKYMKKFPTHRNIPADAAAWLKDLKNKLDEAKQAAAAGDNGITLEEFRRRSQAHLKRARARRK